MGANNSISTTSQSVEQSSATSTRLCCIPRPRWPNMMDKLRRTLLHCLKFKSQQRRRSGRRIGGALGRPMPRCSSFGSSGSLLGANKSKSKPNTYQSDIHYIQWKRMFECAGNKSNHPKRCHYHDISETLAGQTTPRGFPSHTDPNRCRLPEVQNMHQQPLYDQVDEFKVRRRLSFRLPKLIINQDASAAGGSNNIGTIRRPNARERAAEAKMQQQLEKDLYDIEDYYGGFHYAQRNERYVRI